jgi:large subunit ribosomal protein L15
MRIHQLSLKYKRKNIKRIGRGGKRGFSSGHGQKGQRSRSGHVIRPAERDIILKIPKLRGVKNRSRQANNTVLNVGDIAKYVTGGIVNKEILLKRGFLRKTSEEVKILGEGEVKQTYQIEGLLISVEAKRKIEQAGGEVIAPAPKAPRAVAKPKPVAAKPAPKAEVKKAEKAPAEKTEKAAKPEKPKKTAKAPKADAKIKE